MSRQKTILICVRPTYARTYVRRTHAPTSDVRTYLRPTYARTYVRNYATKFRRKQTPEPRRASFLQTYTCWQSKYTCPFSSKSSKSLNLMFKVRFESNTFGSSYVIISQTASNIAIANTESRMWPLHWNIYNWTWLILKVKVQVMRISTVNI